MVAPRKTSSAARRERVSSRAPVSDSRDPPCSCEEVPSLASLGRDDASSTILQATVLFQLSHGPRFVATLFVQAGEVVMRVGVLRVDDDGALIRFGRFFHATEIFERDAEVEGGDRMLRIALKRGTIVLLCRGRRALLVKKTAEVDVCVGVCR